MPLGFTIKKAAETRPWGNVLPEGLVNLQVNTITYHFLTILINITSKQQSFYFYCFYSQLVYYYKVGTIMHTCLYQKHLLFCPPYEMLFPVILTDWWNHSFSDFGDQRHKTATFQKKQLFSWARSINTISSIAWNFHGECLTITEELMYSNSYT
jgi:hypothetical protein